MARVTPEEAEKTRQKIIGAVINCLLDPHVGYEKMTYTRLQTMTGISRGGILNHFKKKEDFLNALDGKVFNTVLTSLNFNCRDSFTHSFEQAIIQPEFRAVLLLLITNLTSNHATQQAKESWQQFEKLIEDRLGSEVKEQDLPRLLGRSCAAIVNNQT